MPGKGDGWGLRERRRLTSFCFIKRTSTTLLLITSVEREIKILAENRLAAHNLHTAFSHAN